uniref:Intimal thickness related receptor IRP domain-containing protein n=1 Tax=Dunaliella tertiolecta TaxID=3047 RepID=A0A7S3VTZ2_DUNTE|mmetsp:Transcript_21491/g.59502  ORF Transcript_21491/g.59502 Transcript_21491/m.59502 type:complete len:431 (+) Transcript_21491:109-1401(+)|eukprot:CAMPEP_0202346386 /NCGR_PEP_ID=MMETSP1126-20121109/5199_1 /ASSEMBLY_ACC=CAM_ASM_000457 /TAXON_ID=3047 /ORGANISM="Dunaliella tertiolecta, Strain CCMP1320" /LENGTH=430 /DNA_ID=CAMNT_0048937787 /DNA_START=111 /DNA_END=1403 /DNA_ORIENTATION=+
MKLAVLSLLCVVLGPSLLHCVNAKIHYTRLDKDDRKLVPLTEAFGFSEGGTISIKMSNYNLYHPFDQELKVDNSHFGFFLWPVEADAALEQDLMDGSECILKHAGTSSVFNFTEPGMQKLISKEAPEFKQAYSVSPGLFYLYFANCDGQPISFTSIIELYNNKDGVKDYLSVGETELETVYWVMFALFTAIAVAWSWFVWRERQHAHRVHILMGALCYFKALTVLSQAGMNHYIERTGHADGWNIAYYIFTFCRGILFFTVVVLIGTGWSYMKPFLGDKEKRILLVVVPLQVFANIAIVITEEESPSVIDWFTWRDVFHLVDIICCCAILFPIVWSIKHLREASQTDGKAARNLEKLTLFRQFYIMVVVYIYFTRIVVYLLKSTVQYEYSWTSEGAEQLATLAFYVWTAVRFRPQSNNPYLRLDASEIEL